MKVSGVYIYVRVFIFHLFLRFCIEFCNCYESVVFVVFHCIAIQCKWCYIIGVGEGRSMSELEKIVTEPIPMHLFEVENQDALHVIRSKLLTVLCQGQYIIIRLHTFIVHLMQFRIYHCA